MAGLLAVRRGARPNARLLLIIGLITVAVLTVLPPAGSTDPLDYATYGRLLLLGHSPYVYTPHYLRHLHDAFAQSIPLIWSNYVSVYGPLATMEQLLAAKLGGSSPALIVFWLKLWNSAGFAAVAVAIHRLLRADPAARLRGHLLWTLNPLLLWDLVEAGHVDVLAAAAGLFGLLVLGRQAHGERPGLARVLAAGVLLGVAADIKINYALFGLGAAWALRRYPAALAAAGAAALAVLVPSYAYFGKPAVRALLSRRDSASADNFYRLILPSYHLVGIVAAVPGHRDGGPHAAAAPAGRPSPAGHPADRGAGRGLAVPVALSAALVRRDDHLRAGAVPGDPAGLAGAGPAHGRHPRQDARQPAAPAWSRAEPARPLRDTRRRAAGHPGRGGRPGRAVLVRAVESTGSGRPAAGHPQRGRGSGTGDRLGTAHRAGPKSPVQMDLAGRHRS